MGGGIWPQNKRSPSRWDLIVVCPNLFWSLEVSPPLFSSLMICMFVIVMNRIRLCLVTNLVLRTNSWHCTHESLANHSGMLLGDHLGCLDLSLGWLHSRVLPAVLSFLCPGFVFCLVEWLQFDFVWFCCCCCFGPHPAVPLLTAPLRMALFLLWGLCYARDQPRALAGKTCASAFPDYLPQLTCDIFSWLDWDYIGFGTNITGVMAGSS